MLAERATLGEAAIAGIPLATNQGFKSIIPNAETDSVFTYYLMSGVRREMTRLASGTTFLEISKWDFENIRVRRPKLPEQRRIAAVLGAVDKAIAKTEAVIAKLKQVRAGLLHDLLTRGLDEHGQLRDPTAHPEQFQDSPLGRIPHDWHAIPLREHTISSAYGPRFSSERYSQGGKIALLRTTDMDDEGNLLLDQMPLANLDVDEFRPHLLEPGDLLISRSGTCGVASVFAGYRLPVLPGAFVIRFRLAKTLRPEFMQTYINSPIGRCRVLRVAEGGVQKNLRGSELLDLAVPTPHPDEQQRILSFQTNAGREIQSLEAQLDKLRFLRSGLMTDFLTGRVRVPEGII